MPRPASRPALVRAADSDLHPAAVVPPAPVVVPPQPPAPTAAVGRGTRDQPAVTRQLSVGVDPMLYEAIDSWLSAHRGDDPRPSKRTVVEAAVRAWLAKAR